MAITKDQLSEIGKKPPQEVKNIDPETAQGFTDLGKAMEKAEHDTTPFAVMENENVIVAGDANKTEVVKKTYTGRFRYKKEMAESIGKENISRETDNYVYVDVTFDDIEVTPRRRYPMISGLQEILLFFRGREESGEMTKLSEKEQARIIGEFSDEALDAVYRFVGAFLGIDNRMLDHLCASSALGLCHQFMEDFPDAFNEADVLLD